MTTEYKKPSHCKQEELPEIYVADLADYNAGILRGRWIEIGDYTDADDIREAIREMLSERGHEEWAIHDYSNLPSRELGEWPDLDKVVAVAHAVIEHGYDLVNAYLSVFSLEELHQFEARFIGVYSSLVEYVEEYIDDCINLEEKFGEFARYFDYQAYADDLEMNGDIDAVHIPGGNVAIFWAA